MTVSVVLLTATGMFLQMVSAARGQRVGYTVEGVVMLETDARYSGYTATEQVNVVESLRRRIAAIPGVQTAILSRGLPMRVTGLPLVIEGGARPSGEAGVVVVGSVWAPPGFFEAMQIPILFGRAVEPRDRLGAPLVAVVSETMAQQYFGSSNAVGRRFRLDQDPKWIEVVGVARDTGTDDLNDDLIDPTPQLFYRPFSQSGLSPNTVVARTSSDAAALVGAMQRELLSLDPSLPVLTAQTMAERLERSLGIPRAVATFLGVSGALGLSLAAIGLYAVIAFSVARRRREIGIRMALGASRREVTRGIAGEAAGLLGIGAAAGLTLATIVILAMRAFSNPAPGVAIYRPSVDPIQFAAIAGFLVIVGALAALVPASRAARMNPLASLRQE